MLPDTSLSRMVIVVVDLVPSSAPTGSPGPSMMEKVSCHSMSLLYNISIGNSCDLTPESTYIIAVWLA